MFNSDRYREDMAHAERTVLLALVRDAECSSSDPLRHATIAQQWLIASYRRGEITEDDLDVGCRKVARVTAGTADAAEHAWVASLAERVAEPTDISLRQQARTMAPYLPDEERPRRASLCARFLSAVRRFFRTIQ